MGLMRRDGVETRLYSHGASLSNLSPLEQKYQSLEKWFIDAKNVMIAYSGGVDSGFLAHTVSTLGDKVESVLVMGISPSLGDGVREEARAFANRLGLDLWEIQTNEMENPRYRENQESRCFYCKEELFGKLRSLAEDKGFEVICDGTNADDISDHRPGLKAKEKFGIASPLLECGLTKRDIRELSNRFGLELADKPSMPCFASRIAYGIEIDREKLVLVEKCETWLRKRFPGREIRVRYHGEIARVEVEQDLFPALLEVREEMVDVFKQAGFVYVSLDLEGYRRGSLLRSKG